MEPLRSIVYVSTASWRFTTAELEALLDELRARNRANEITGLLLYNEGTFMQCLEGETSAVAAAFARIRASKRHGEIVELLNETITRRRFADWQMAFARPSAAELDALRAANRWRHSRDANTGRTIPDALGLFLLHEFWGRIRTSGADAAVHGEAGRRTSTPAERVDDNPTRSEHGTRSPDRPAIETDLRSIVYHSMAVHPMTAEDLTKLLITARDFNAQSGVTGLLVYRDGIFLQCFEGGSAAVDETYERIRRSSQHTGIVELLNSPMTRRSFGDWRMAFAMPSADEMLALRQASWFRTTLEAGERWSDAAGIALLRAFWQGLWRERQAPQRSVRTSAG